MAYCLSFDRLGDEKAQGIRVSALRNFFRQSLESQALLS
jgi:hypothetical protein